jgi:hypothetical protein
VTQARVFEGRRLVGLVESTNVGAGRDGLIDTVEHVVGEADVQAGEQVVEVLVGPRAEECAGDAGVGDGERPPGWAMVIAIARWVMGTPTSAARATNCSTTRAGARR